MRGCEMGHSEKTSRGMGDVDSARMLPYSYIHVKDFCKLLNGWRIAGAELVPRLLRGACKKAAGLRGLRPALQVPARNRPALLTEGGFD